jgi:hypothetical protein
MKRNMMFEATMVEDINVTVLCLRIYVSESKQVLMSLYFLGIKLFASQHQLG